MRGRLQARLDALVRRFERALPASVLSPADHVHRSQLDVGSAFDLRMVSRGEPAPRICQPDLEGNDVDLAMLHGGPVLLLFWSPGSAHCEELLPHVLAVESALAEPRMVVISRGSVSVNRELGFASPVVLDEDRSIAQAFGITGTPAAVQIGPQGTVDSGVARGAAAVRICVDRYYINVTTTARARLNGSGRETT
jgi:thiol-disulfide isomerase/thioredoxin